MYYLHKSGYKGLAISVGKRIIISAGAIKIDDIAENFEVCLETEKPFWESTQLTWN